VTDATGAATTADVVSAVNFAVAHNAKILNMSLGGPALDAAFNSALSAADTAGVISIVAAGNDGTNNDAGHPDYPCNYLQSNLICVAALDQKYALASFSNFGDTSVDVAAPGVNILSSWPGPELSVTDPLSSGWLTNSGWGFKSLNFGVATNALVNPASYDYTSAKYGNNVNDHTWKTFSITGASVAIADYYIMYDLEDNHDYLGVFASNAAGDPVSSGTVLVAYTGSTSGFRIPQSVDLTDFISSTTTIGFDLETDATGTDFGTNITLFSIKTMVYNSTTYNVISGTSMATPHVAGLAAMIMAYNPDYTASEVVAAVKFGGDSQGVLAAKTTSGRSVNAMGSLAYIAAPTGVTATKQ
jgi:subtilisin family serine protease